MREGAFAQAGGLGSPSQRTGDWGGSATFSGAIVTVFAPASIVAELLPRALRLVPTSSFEPPEGTHPIVFILGEMTDGGFHMSGYDFASGVAYREMAVMIPFVAHERYPGPFVFPSSMFADDALPVWLGNSFYGLRKGHAKIEWDG